ncbi:hypothetical protein PG279_10130 [Riemerella anatipestifer]|nr:hypothetical protein [Riemerella anatipestifer]
MINLKFKKTVLFGLVAFSFLLFMSCRNDSNESIESKMENYTLKEQSLKSLSPFSINFNIKRINIDKINDRQYKVSSLRAAGRRGNSEIVENTNVSLDDSFVVFSTTMFSNLYSIKKDVTTGTLFFL